MKFYVHNCLYLICILQIEIVSLLAYKITFYSDFDYRGDKSSVQFPNRTTCDDAVSKNYELTDTNLTARFILRDPVRSYDTYTYCFLYKSNEVKEEIYLYSNLAGSNYFKLKGKHFVLRPCSIPNDIIEFCNDDDDDTAGATTTEPSVTTKKSNLVSSVLGGGFYFLTGIGLHKIPKQKFSGEEISEAEEIELNAVELAEIPIIPPVRRRRRSLFRGNVEDLFFRNFLNAIKPSYLNIYQSKVSAQRFISWDFILKDFKDLTGDQSACNAVPNRLDLQYVSMLKLMRNVYLRKDGTLDKDFLSQSQNQAIDVLKCRNKKMKKHGSDPTDPKYIQHHFVRFLWRDVLDAIGQKLNGPSA